MQGAGAAPHDFVLSYCTLTTLPELTPVKITGVVLYSLIIKVAEVMFLVSLEILPD